MDQFDVIVIGGGSAGSAAAGRLAEDPSRSVCLLEAGGTNDNMWVKTPGFMPWIPKKSNYRFDTVPQKGLNGRIGYQPRGRGLGGSLAINAMIYIRGNKFDYDQWAQLGRPGWAYDDVLPYFKRAEGNERGGDEFHGSNGPLNVMDQRWPNPGSKAFVTSAESSHGAARPILTARSKTASGSIRSPRRPVSAGQRRGPICPRGQTWRSGPGPWLKSW